ncbi:uncharacterized protein LOC111639132 [Centruroides sculpturatus]|uniref:uncharacterized protein LOC111639132 n=1 Tax=Centruroides sculpturatus TaxID=218467 RepID=UPI000C6E5475|nr:uncharacterized protein LOC111639132 [Centruroides sculpturatus]XP_023240682.1 uncharacterized protein LOC111639132 [Centruroides sculpturatus]XP_023240683.1 uncharacterized protein LOC111639132 [Centruroides sculpturatus]
MAETALEKTTETGAISPRGCTLIGGLPEIMIHIFQYLKDEELDLCSRVCILWRDIIVNIMYHQVTIITRRIPLSVIYSAIDESENLRPYVGFDDHFQYNWFVVDLGDEPEPTIESTYDLIRFGETTLPFIPGHEYSDIIDKLYRNDGTRLFPDHYKLALTAEIQISMFPNIPGFNIINYSLKHFGIRCLFHELTDLKEKMKNVYHKLNIPDEQKKCVIICKDFALREITYKVMNYSIYSNGYRLTIFHGEKVDAFAFYFLNAFKTGYRRIKKQLEMLKYSEFQRIEKRCFLYIFHRRYLEWTHTPARAFLEVFPQMNYVAFKCLPLYISVPGDEDYFHGEYDYKVDSIIMVFVW